jgi:hypothetical protein
LVNFADEVPGEQIGDAADGMISDTFQELREVKLRIDAVQLRRADQRIERGGSLVAVI